VYKVITTFIIHVTFECKKRKEEEETIRKEFGAAGIRPYDLFIKKIERGSSQPPQLGL
jgi:hypothetical protein